tara:strand:+ start:10621 stop:10899 length:279 start_codon:yes stop_codon:yes gene_type:complete
LDFQAIYQIIINEPIYLTITIILLSIIAFSILKKLFKMMVTILIILVVYVVYLMWTGQDLPNEENINAIKEKVVKGVEQGIDQLDKMSRENN